MKLITTRLCLAKAAESATGGGGKGPKAGAKAKPEDTKEEIAISPAAELSTDVLGDILADAGAGSESMGKDDLAIPRLTILQALSPACQKRTDTYIEGADAGHIMDTVSNAIHDGETGIVVVPCTYRRTHIEWKPRDSGGGFVADHGANYDLASCTRGEKGEYITKGGNNIVATAEYFIMLLDKETGVMAPYVLSMSGVQIKHSKKWNTLINTLRISAGGKMINPAMFYRAYHLTTVPDGNDKGDWFAWSIKGDVNLVDLEGGHELYLQCRSFRESVVSGALKAAEPRDDASGGAPRESEESPM